MKLPPSAIKLSSLLISWALKLWLGTLDWRFVLAEPEVNPLRARRPLLYAFWHEVLLGPAYTHAPLKIAVLVSKHRDGELIAQVVRMLRGATVRGSTTRGAVPALREMIRLGGTGHLAITPDGPKGPRRQFQAGGVYLASRGGMDIVPCGFGMAKCWRAPSWDRMALPRPFQPARVVIGRPIHVPPDLTLEQVEQYRLDAQRALVDVQQRAEALADARAITPDMLTLADVLNRP
jgi:lysophospholipid acyltransferase (LPLAT)-like uncharacterized protein